MRATSRVVASTCTALLCGLWVPAALADSNTSTGGLPRTVSADLRFQLSIDKVLYFRIGDGTLPTVGGTTSTVSYDVGLTIPALPTTPTAGNNKTVDWSGVAPSLAVTPTGNVLPVEVRSNGGQVSLRAVVVSALSAGSATIPMSAISVSSSDPALPAPPLPASGTGTAVNVTGGGSGAFNSLVTLRNANWTFTLAGGNYAAGVYNGQVAFTASAP